MCELTDQELCGKFAELEDLNWSFGELCVFVTNKGLVGNVIDKYNPVENKHLIVDAIIKYEVDVDHYSGCVSIASEYTDRPAQSSRFFEDNFGRAVIECILEKEGVI